MKLKLPTRWWLTPFVLAFLHRAETPALLSLTIAVLLPFLSIELSASFKLALAVAFLGYAAQMLSGPEWPPVALRYAQDLWHSRLGSVAYDLLGDIFEFADEVAPVARVPQPVRGQVTVVRTAWQSGERLTVLAPLALVTGAVPQGHPAVTVNPSVHFQELLGFGGSFTESSADLLLELSPKKQEQVINAFYGSETGLGFRLGRLHMGSCDFSKGNWSCADRPGDMALESFSIERYEASILPMVRRAMAAAGQQLLLVASPWSPPAWMKDTGRMVVSGKLKPEYRATWAKYYVRFAQALASAGTPLWAFTVQNEPHAETPWENCIYTHAEERDFVRDHLGPALEASGLDLKLIVWDHNRDDMFARANAIYSDPVAEKYIWGVGYHWYGDPRYEFWPAKEGQVLFKNLQRVHELRPDKHIIMTEACQEFGPRIGDWALGERYGEAIIQDLNNWLEAWIDWNILLDTKGGPNHVNNLVSAPAIADVKRDRVLLLSSYYYLGQFSRHIKPGAHRVLVAANRDALQTTAFLNQDGSLAIVVMNQGATGLNFWLDVAGKVAWVEAPAHSISTFLVSADDAGGTGKTTSTR